MKKKNLEKNEKDEQHATKAWCEETINELSLDTLRSMSKR